MKRLGAIIAGGKSSRFGSDKGAALLDGRALIDHVADGLRAQVDALIICGRDWPGLISVTDRPAPDLGPLGGLSAALAYAVAHGFGTVMTAGCDTLPVPDMATMPAPAVVAGHYLSGVWPAALATALQNHLAITTDRSLRHWIAVTGARRIVLPTALHNLNTRDDFAHYAQTQGLAA